jgi:hypothetical protein
MNKLYKLPKVEKNMVNINIFKIQQPDNSNLKPNEILDLIAKKYYLYTEEDFEQLKKK